MPPKKKPVKKAAAPGKAAAKAPAAKDKKTTKANEKAKDNVKKTRSKSTTAKKAKSPSPPPANKRKARGKSTKAKSPSPPPQKNTKRGRTQSKNSKKTKSKSPSPQKKVKKDDTKNVKKTQSKESVKVETVVVKGGAAVDKHCPKKDELHVLNSGGKIYNCMLNQSNLGANNNKFYVIQVLQNDKNSGQCYCFTRWGRVGVPGQQAFMGPFADSTAIAQYNKKFHDKCTKGGYKEIELNYGDDDEEEEEEQKTTAAPQANANAPKVESKLHKSTQDLMNLIFDTKLMDQTMKEIGYDPKKMPLGKLAESSIQKGYTALKSLMTALKETKPNKNTLQELSSDFYTYIPHDFGFKKMIDQILDDEEKVKNKLNMLQALTDMKLTTKLLSQAPTVEDSLVDQNYKKLKCNLTALDKEKQKDVWKLIETCVVNTKEHWKVDIKNIWEVDRDGESQRFDKSIGNNRLLWHGSRVTNYVGILSQGLRIAPPEAPVSGYLYGKGVYLADQFSKSAHYCRGTGTDILIMLVDTAVGNPKVYERPYSGAADLPPGCDSTKGFGNMAPTEESYVKLPVKDNDVSIPQGKPQRTTSSNYQGHNEYIVYKLNQCRVRYLLKVGLNY